MNQEKSMKTTARYRDGTRASRYLPTVLFWAALRLSTTALPRRPKVEPSPFRWGKLVTGLVLVLPFVLVTELRAQVAPRQLTKLAVGYQHSVVLCSDGTLRAWGYNGYGQLGDGTFVSRYIEARVGSASEWASVSAGEYNTFAFKIDGTLWAWGCNTYGQLGDGTFVNRSTPVQVGSASEWASVSAGDWNTFALKTDGTLWAWGYNANGELGDGTFVNRSTPVRVGSASDWVAVAVGSDHRVALKNNGTLWAWGYNGYGQLGDGTFLRRFTPVQVGSANDWAAVATRRWHNLALKNDGSLWSWGFNYTGELGDGTLVDKSTPVRVGGASDWAAVSAGWFHSVALKNDGSLWAWGYNGGGQLGDGTLVNKSTPVRVGSASDWAPGAACRGYSLAMKTDGSLRWWGDTAGGGVVTWPSRVPFFPEPVKFAISDICSPGANAAAVNSQSQIVGVYSPFSPDAGRGYVWTPMAGVTDLGTLGGGYTRAYDINARSEIVGIAKDSSGELRGFRLRPLDTDENGTPDLWDVDKNEDDVNDLMERLEHQQYRIEIAAINNEGIIAGDYYALDNTDYRRGMLWRSDNSSTDLGGPPGLKTQPSDINDFGMVVGNVGQSITHPFIILPRIINGSPVWYEDISPLDGNNDLMIELDEFVGYRAMAVNNAGTVCLRSYGPKNSVLWRGTEVVATLSPDANVYARANALNDHEQVVGRIETSDGNYSEAFIWTAKSGFIKLPGLGGTITTALGIDPSGTIIVGAATDEVDEYHGVRWTIPVNTDQGANSRVCVESENGGTGFVEVRFLQVTSPGVTVFTSSTTGPELPSGFKLGESPVFYELSTSAIFDGVVLVGFSYSPSDFTSGTPLRLLHYENGQWKDVTTFVNTINHIIWGRVASFSPFAIVESTLVVRIEQPASGFLTSVNTPVAFTGSFIDSPVVGPYTAQWTLSSETVPEYSEPATVAVKVDGGTVQSQIPFSTPGVYAVKLTVSDNGRSRSGEATTVANDLPAYVVVYDPTGGFATGGGWIDSPLGAYIRDPLLTSKASFGFVSKYLKGANVPTGNTEFQFKAGDLSFKSTAYQWLVVAGARAQFKGWGTINGQGNYAFILTAIDGQVNGGGGADRFRIKIWDMATDALVYDNQVGTGDEAELGDATVIQGGSIVIHKP
jgi:alpha-tubulin suppressor-like RCC1 family protein